MFSIPTLPSLSALILTVSDPSTLDPSVTFEASSTTELSDHLTALPSLRNSNTVCETSVPASLASSSVNNLPFALIDFSVAI